MSTSSLDLKTRRFDLIDADEDLINRWDVQVVLEDDWVEIYNVKYINHGEEASLETVKNLIFAAPLDEAVEFFEKVLGYLKEVG